MAKFSLCNCKMWQNDAHKTGLFLAAPTAKKVNRRPAARAEGTLERILAFCRLRVCVLALNLALYRENVAKRRTQEGLFLAASPAQKDKRPSSSARRRRAREKLEFLRQQVCVFGLILALHLRMWQNDAHEKCLFLAAPPARKDKKTGHEREKNWRFEAASMCF